MTTMTTTARAAVPSTVRRLLADHPLLAYFCIAYGGTWAMLLVPVLAQNGLGVLPFMVPDIAMVVLFILGTLVAAWPDAAEVRRRVTAGAAVAPAR